MKKTAILLAILSLLLYSGCKKEKETIDLIDFEELDPGQSGYWNGSGNEGGFGSGNGWFVNNYNAEWSSWSGFSYTSHTDTGTGDYTNMYSSFTGSGEELSEIYSTYYYSGTPDTLKFLVPEKVTNISVSNSTYAYKTMLNGNEFAKKFGGPDGTDPDWFLLILTTLGEDGNPVIIYSIYLADYRSDNSSLDYISNVWNSIDLSESGYISGIVLQIESSDTGQYGINTPAYACIDNIRGVIKPVD